MNDKLNEPKEITEKESAVETCELILEESIEDIFKIRHGNKCSKPSYRGEDYDLGYAQGRKDACRVVLLSFGIDKTITSIDYD